MTRKLPAKENAATRENQIRSTLSNESDDASLTVARLLDELNPALAA